MTIELTLTNLIALGVAFIGMLWALFKVFAIQHEKALEARFKLLNQSMENITKSQGIERENTLRIERELMQFKAELPRDYVRREDFIRAVGTIETKIDNMALRVERAVLSKGGDA
jgi:hypothetical protein